MNFDNFSLRLLTASDAELFFGVVERNRPRLEAFFSGTVARTRTLKDTRDYIIEVVKRIEQKTYLPHFLVDNNDHYISGFIDLKNIDWNIPRGELGYFIDEKYVNQGIGTKMLRTFIEHCFEQQGFQKLFLRTHETNYSARKIAENCGFEIEGKLRRDYKTTEGELVDLLYYGKVNPLSP
jgi:ribosomal-protein-serine acetyltransferase